MCLGPPPRTRGTLAAVPDRGGCPGTTPAYAGNALGRFCRLTSGRDHPRVRGERYEATTTSSWGRGPPPRTRGTPEHQRRWTRSLGTTPAYAGNAGKGQVIRLWTRDHPRVRGERLVHGLREVFEQGPPPRTRGTQVVRHRPSERHRTTPAYAGNASFTTAYGTFGWDHPRVRGERNDPVVLAYPSMGPPPRTRGTLHQPVDPLVLQGTTPAYAGNAKEPQAKPPAHGDHPRVRGERAALFKVSLRHPGPPPRTRGTLEDACLDLEHVGTTPAYAGNAPPPDGYPTTTRDHPRVRGERGDRHGVHDLESGPPPRTRGTHVRLDRGHLGVGTTPAYAGNAYAGGARGLSRRDHPRVRGERAVTGRAGVLIWGPPPRTRGTRYVEDDHGGDLGTTPAYAGNAPASVPATRRARDHPRVRGERKTRPSRLRGLMGPPPRTRGTRAAALPPDRPQGTTPAYAGNATARAAGRSGG